MIRKCFGGKEKEYRAKKGYQTTQEHLSFSDYIVSTYIDEFSEFPPAIWASDNIKGQEQQMRAEEVSTSTFSKYFNCPHPNIFVFIEAADEEMKKSTLKIRGVKKPQLAWQASKGVEAIKQKEACVRDFKMGTT
ncbi:hypothetical protein RRG08_027558 [Elysia crispata]|uniref:Uncharacterized protein n=1 Tax=Elysia crispata TaxID=231223 RepID=A0AAE1DKZ2_9GAST|nr:hypothetical protein RRG08_027558 [Elysia crispata]